MLGIGTPVLSRGRGAGQLAWAEDTETAGDPGLYCVQDKYQGMPLFPSHGLPSKNKNSDAVCLNLKTCIYKHLMVLLPGERGRIFTV